MALPLLTYRVTTNYNISVAGSNATVLELLTAIKAAFDAEAVIGGNYWTVSAADVGGSNPAYVELKRTGSPSGKQGTCRVLLFGGTVPNAAALSVSLSASAADLYALISEDANTTGPTNAYNSAHPYGSGLRSTRGVRFMGPANTVVAAAATPQVCIVESEETVAVIIRTTAGRARCLAGACMESLSSLGTRIWGALCTGWCAVGSYDTNGNAAGVSAILPVLQTTAAPSGNTYAAFVNESGASELCCRARVNTSVVTSSQDETPTGVCVLSPILVNRRADNAATVTVQPLLGKMRQFKEGPAVAGKRALYDNTATLRGYVVGSVSATGDYGGVFTVNE